MCDGYNEIVLTKRAIGIFGALLLGSCSSPETTEPLGRAQAAILGGRPSGDDENAAVLVQAGDPPAFCSGRLVAPRLVLTARHCLLRTPTKNLQCNADGSPQDLGSDQTLLAPALVTVGVGSDRTALRTVATTDLLTVTEISACKSDIAFLVLAEDALPVHTPFRRTPVRIGDVLTVTGWGLTGDDQADLPVHRSTLDALRVQDVGPGFIPAGTFATGGDSMCFGDSGAVPLIGGAVIGTYSRMSGNACALPDTQHVFTATATQGDLVARAFAAVGEQPTYADDPPPDGGACPPCASGETCTDGVCAVAGDTPAAPPRSGGSCTVSASVARPPWVAIALASLALLRRRRRASHMHLR